MDETYEKQANQFREQNNYIYVSNLVINVNKEESLFQIEDEY